MIPAGRRPWPAATVALLALATTITTLGHDFTYDDRGVIFENERVHSLAHLPHMFVETYWPPKYGGDGYRPVVMVMYALQWAARGGAPWIFHLVNILLAVAASVAVYWCARAILPELAAWVAGALFAVHPVHVEVTGNVVGQSELIVALCLCIAVGLYLRQRLSPARELGSRAILVITALFAVALFTKEHAIVLPGILLAAEATVIADEAWSVRLRRARLLLLLLVMVASAYLLARSLVQRDLTGFVAFPIFRFLHMSAVDRIGTMMNEMPAVAQLLVLPTHLSGDYSPSDVIVASGFSLTQLPGIVICLGVVVLALVFRQRAPVVSFGLLWLMVAFLPVSNLVVPAGFVVAERTLFFPSVGVMLIAGAIVASGERRRLVLGVAAVLLAAGMARSIDRQRVWKNNDTFFTALMRDAPNGYRAHFLYARHVGLKSRLTEMEREYRKAIRIFPYDAAMTLSVADAYTRAGICQPAVTLFEWTFTVDPTIGEGRYQYVYCLAKLGRWSDVRREALSGLRLVAPRDIKLMREAVHQANLALARKQSS